MYTFTISWVKLHKLILSDSEVQKIWVILAVASVGRMAILPGMACCCCCLFEVFKFVFPRDCPTGGGGGGDDKCRNCRQEVRFVTMWSLGFKDVTLHRGTWHLTVLNPRFAAAAARRVTSRYWIFVQLSANKNL